jgi:glycosyltransferase involved in cell wall biosynthesis
MRMKFDREEKKEEEHKMYKYQFTVFTCCYNGAHTIHRVIESLKKQTFRDFEWIILNNGSTDNLDEIIKPLIEAKIFPIKYLSLSPNNFQVAQNMGVSNAEGEFYVIFNADDALVDNALEVFYSTYQALPENVKNEISGVITNCSDQNGNLIGTLFPLNNNTPPPPYLLCNELEMRHKYKVKGEKFGFVKTDIMKAFPYSVIDKYVPENHIWFAIAEKYKAVYINASLRIYYIHSASLSHQNLPFPAGTLFFCQEVVNKYLSKMYPSFADILMWYCRLTMYSLYANKKISLTISEINKRHKRLFACLCIPLGYLMYGVRKILKG